MQAIDDMAWTLQNVEGVQDVTTISSATKMIATNMNEVP